ncbi:ribonuclease HII [Saccharobesus litoralis]|uniref:Ribonuclease HII n=1 Tax=Saccharobesus litoralis TaxID=2172099 RepID=A0A2S0VVA6_9ALTE|nr:ribonuclease HII [Saccharobesus litoralis]AWB68138.1 ribonuclease HII [Saccharobesus litoralis]
MQNDLFSELAKDAQLVAGVDEVGRGPLVGSVVAAAVILDPEQPIEGLRDSKKLSDKKRAILEVEIKQKALAWAVAEATASEIDDINILQASFLAMRRAIEGLTTQPELVMVDGNKPVTGITMPCEAIVKGDDLIPAISAASILAKEFRDRQMLELAKQYPDYEFNKHKGYPTKLHMEKLQALGPIEQHRKSFKPVIRALESR